MAAPDVHLNDMDALDAFLDELRASGSAVDAPAPSDALQVLFRDGTIPVAPAPFPRQRRRPAIRVAIAGAVGAFAFGGLGVAGALPAPVQAKVAGIADFVGVNLPDGNPDHGGEPPAAPPAGDTPSEHHDPGNVDEQHKSDNAPTQGDDHSNNGRHVGPDGSIPSTSVPEQHGHDDGVSSTDDPGHGVHRGWTKFPPSTNDTNSQGPSNAAPDNRGGTN